VFNKSIFVRSYLAPALIAIILGLAIVASATLTSYAISQRPSSASPTQTGAFNPQPGYYQARQNPSYVIRIPSTGLGYAPFQPTTVSIPAGMTIIWFNEDQGEHSIKMNTTTSKVTNSTDTLNSDLIPPEGSFTHTFTVPGIYDYYDSQNPSAKGRIKVGSEVQKGENMDMLVGGNDLPFRPDKRESVTLSFVPHANAATIPPNLSLTYNVTIANSTRILYTNQFEDSDGILDLELVPFSKSNTTKHFVSWGPDLTNQEGVASDGAYHILGPVLVDNDLYTIQVSIIGKSRGAVSAPISDAFALPPAMGR
jgi:plastocyanin